MAEEAVRENNMDKMMAVCEAVIEDALEGDFRSRKLVWESMVSKGVADEDKGAKERVEINIRGPAEVRNVSEINHEDIEDAETVS